MPNDYFVSGSNNVNVQWLVCNKPTIFVCLLSNQSMCNFSSLDQPIIQSYFHYLNSESYDLVANLFAEEGILYPPFDQPVIGPESITHYLKTEAINMVIEPLECFLKATSETEKTYEVFGKVTTDLFSVNVGWLFKVDATNRLLEVRVKLLATLRELLKLQQKNLPL